MTPRCNFYVRTPAPAGGWRYEPFSIANPTGSSLPLTHPPAIGDLIWLWDSQKQAGGHHRVIDRAWNHPAWGSMDWPHGDAAPRQGPILDLIVEPAVGLFVDEVSEPDEDEDGEP